MRPAGRSPSGCGQGPSALYRCLPSVAVAQIPRREFVDDSLTHSARLPQVRAATFIGPMT